MKELTVAASAVRKGDRIFWPWIQGKRSGRLDWATVVRTEQASTDNYINLYISDRAWTAKHRREGVAIQRDE